MAHGSGFFAGIDGTMLFERHWQPHAEPLADVILVHGSYDHCSRYSKAACRLVDQRFAVHGYDLRGHAHSEGVRGDFRLAEHCADLEAYAQRVSRRRRTQPPFFLLGNAIGGLIALAYVMNAPTVSVDAIAIIAPAPRIARLSLRARLACLLRSDACVGITPRAATEIDAAWHFVLEGAHTLRVPLFLLQGSDDRMTDPREATAFYARVRSQDKRMRMYPGLAHDLLREPVRDRIIYDLATWFEGLS